jgi:protein-S-isoprenylcysteine O-methyltransferase Ste14
VDLGAFLYRARGFVPVVFVIGAIVFADPRPAVVVPGLVLVLLGEAMRLWSAAYLGGTVRSRSPRAVKLVTRGPYAHLRHPIYAGNFLLTVGYTLATGAGFPGFTALAAIGYGLLYAAHGRREERALAAAFPDAHAAYRAEVPAVGWRVRPADVPEQGGTGSPGWRRALAVELPSLHLELWLLVALWIRSRFP